MGLPYKDETFYITELNLIMGSIFFTFTKKMMNIKVRIQCTFQAQNIYDVRFQVGRHRSS